MSDQHPIQFERAVIDRLDRLRVVLPALAEEAALAKREVARLRAENRRLVHDLAQLQSRPTAFATTPPRPAIARTNPDTDMAAS